MTKAEENAEVFDVIFDSVSYSKTSYSWSTRPPDLEDRDGEQNAAPIIQWETVTGLLHPLDTHKAVGLKEIHPDVLRELAEVLSEPLSIICQQSYLTVEVPADGRLINVAAICYKPV